MNQPGMNPWVSFITPLPGAPYSRNLANLELPGYPRLGYY